MARDDKPQDRGKVRVRVIEFDMEGSNQTLRDSIRDIVGAIGKSSPQNGSQRVAALSSPKRVNEVTDGSTPQDPIDSGGVENEEIIIDQEGEARSPSPRGPRKVKTPRPVAIDLRDGEMPLREFLSKAPDHIEKRYILIAYWFKKYRETPEISQDHVYTAFTEMDWTNIPKDAGQPLRAMKQAGLFDKGSGAGAYALNHLGQGKAVDMIKANGG